MLIMVLPQVVVLATACLWSPTSGNRELRGNSNTARDYTGGLVRLPERQVFLSDKTVL
jgi:peptide methionine sulfoxide reductase MsrA